MILAFPGYFHSFFLFSFFINLFKRLRLISFLQILTLSMLGKNPACDLLKYFPIFPSKQALASSSCKLSLNLQEMLKPVSGKNKEKTKQKKKNKKKNKKKKTAICRLLSLPREW